MIAHALSSAHNADYRDAGWPTTNSREQSTGSAEIFYPDFKRRTSEGVDRTPRANKADRLWEPAYDTLLSTMVKYLALQDDWDGYGGTAPSLETVLDAFHFVRHFPSTFPPPKPMIGGSGIVGLYWEGNGCYASIDFDGSGLYCYIADSLKSEYGEDRVLIGSALPQPLAEVITATTQSR